MPTHLGPSFAPMHRLSCSHSQLPAPAKPRLQAPSTQLVMQASPLAPHAPSLMPWTHAVPLQHPPLQMAVVPLHAVEHAWVDGLHAWLAGHAALVAQPQVPAKQPCDAPHDPQRPPFVPQAPTVSPVTHDPPEQHPPLHGLDEPHAVEHVPPLHACPGGQSDAVAQPHDPVASHAKPLALPAQETHAPPLRPHAAFPVPGWQLVPSQHPPLQVRPPPQPVLHAPALHAWWVGQSAVAPHPQVPPLVQAWPAADAEQSAQAAPLVPHVAGAAPETQSFVPATSQQPPLQAMVVPPTTHVLPQEPVVVSHAWPVGQSLLLAQWHFPATHVLVPEHGPHAAPLVPQAVLDVPSWQAPVESQHPFGQEVGVQEGTHWPAVHVSPAPHGTQDLPPVPQAVADATWHCPSLPQQPLAHVVAVHATDASPSPPVATSCGASAVPSACASPAAWSERDPSEAASAARSPSWIPKRELHPAAVRLSAARTAANRCHGVPCIADQYPPALGGSPRGDGGRCWRDRVVGVEGR